MDAHDPDFGPAPDKRGEPRSNRLIVVLIVVAIGLVGAALFLPAVRTAGEAARRSQCVNNLKQIDLALHNYEQEYGCLPPAATVDASGRALHSWRTLILPYLEQGPLYASIDLSKPWDDPANAKALQTPPPVYRCPSGDEPASTTTYLALVGPDACFAAHAGRPLAAITDGTDSTIAVLEGGPADAVPWMQPSDADAAFLDRFAASKTHHPGGANAAFADGSVKFLKHATPAPILRALRTIAGGDTPSPTAY